MLDFTRVSMVRPPEQMYTLWRHKFDIFFVFFELIAMRTPQAYWALRLSLCAPDYKPEKPYSPSIAADPRFQEFPCPVEPSSFVWQYGHHLLWSLVRQPPASYMWFLARMWWAMPYISFFHTFFESGAFIILQPVLLLTPILAPGWWTTGGRTLVMIVMRVWMCVCLAVSLLLLQPPDGVHLIDRTAQEQYGIVMMLRGVTWTIPFKWHAVVVVFEALSTVLMATTHYRSPLARKAAGLKPNWHQELLWGTSIGASLSLILCAIECSILRELWGDGHQESEAVHPVQQPQHPTFSLASSLRSFWDLSMILVNCLLTLEGLVLMLHVVLLMYADDTTLPSWLVW